MPSGVPAFCVLPYPDRCADSEAALRFCGDDEGKPLDFDIEEEETDTDELPNDDCDGEVTHE